MPGALTSGSVGNTVPVVSPLVQSWRDTPVGSGMTVLSQTQNSALASATSTVTGTLLNPDSAGWPVRANTWNLHKFPGGGTPNLNGSDAWLPMAPKRSDGSEASTFQPSIWSLDFDWQTIAGAIEVAVYDLTELRFIVDGLYASAALASSFPSSEDFGWKYVKLSGVPAGYHQIRVEFGGKFNSFAGIKVATADQIFPPSIPKTKRLAVVSDSFGEGYGDPPFGATVQPSVFGYIGHLARRLGFSDMTNHSAASTGMTTPTSPDTTYQTRLPDVVTANPDYLMIQGSTNDTAQVAGTLPAKALACYQAYKAALPNCKIVATGIIGTNPTNRATYDAITAVLATAAAAAGVQFLDTTGWCPTISTMVYSDGTHPTIPGGHNYDAHRLAPVLASAAYWNLAI